MNTAQDDPENLETLAKAFGFVNQAFLSLIGVFIVGASVASFFPPLSPALLLFPVLLVVCNLAFIIAIISLAKKTLNVGWITAFLVGFFGHFITAIICGSIASKTLKKHGYKIGFVRATKIPTN